jgi:hypothetical protein
MGADLVPGPYPLEAGNSLFLKASQSKMSPVFASYPLEAKSLPVENN